MDRTPPDAGPGGVRTRLVLLVACLAQFVVVLDVSIVNVALPAMRTALGFDATGLQWVVNTYTLAFAGFLLLGGRAADVFGRRRMLLVGLGLFGVASLVGGLADTPGLLLAARAAQGLGGAVLAPASLTVLTTTFSGDARSRALGLWAGVGGLGGATGGLAGGVLVQALSWRWIFLVNVPIVAATAAVALAVIHETRADRRPHLDVVGAVLVTAGMLALVHGVVSSESASWGSPLTWGSLAAAVVLLGAFLVVQRRSADPLVPLEVFRIRAVSTANVVMFGMASAMFSMWYFVSLHLQNVLGFDALTTGLAFLPQSLSVLAGSQLSSRLLPRCGPRVLIVGGAVMTAVGFALFATLTAQTSWTAGVLAPGILVSLGMGLVFAPVTTAATSGVGPERAGLVSGLVTTFRQTGGAIGLAVLATLATARSTALLARGVPLAEALTAGTTRAFTIAAVVVAVTAVVGLAVPPSPRGGGAAAADDDAGSADRTAGPAGARSGPRAQTS